MVSIDLGASPDRRIKLATEVDCRSEGTGRA